MTLGNLIAALQLNNEHLIRRFFDENYDWLSMKAHVLDEALHVSPLEQQQWDLAYGHISDNDKHVSSQNRTEWDEAHSHVSNNDVHVTPQDKEKWNNANTHTGDAGSHTSADDRNSWDAAYQHTLNNDIHVTADDKDSWNAAEQNAKDYAKALFDAVKTLKIHICTDGVLPTENINTLCIYFVPLTDGEGNNLYEEYMYVDNNWERIGQTSVDLSQYVKKTEILNYVQQHANKAVLDKLSQDSEGNLIYDGKKIATDIDISVQQGNALFMAPDGLYVPTVPDLSDDFNALQGNVKENHKNINRISQYHKFLKNEPLGYAHLFYTGVYNDEGANYIFKPTAKSNDSIYTSYAYNGIEIDYTTGIITLKAGKRYFVEMGPMYTATGNTGVFFLTALFNINSNIFYCSTCNYKTGTIIVPNTNNAFITVPEDTDIQVGLKLGTGASITNVSYQITVNIIEIGHDIMVDPAEHVNDQQGIEDTPVGHILAYMGNTPPKHYLVCDGSVYNILDYPELANHILDEFGSYDYWGGDGENTFAVPDLTGEFLRGTGKNGAEVGRHQEPTKLNGNAAASKTYSSGSTTNNKGIFVMTSYLQNHEGQEQSSGTRYFTTSTISARSANEYYYSTRPTNTAVLYCIKYEKTYFMNITKTVEYEQLELLRQQNELLREEIRQLSSIVDQINRTVV